MHLVYGVLAQDVGPVALSCPRVEAGGFLGTTVGTADQEACRASMNQRVGCTSNCGGTATSGLVVTCSNCTGGTVAVAFAPFVIPQPQPDETYSGYLERLRAKGWLGAATITVSALDSALSGPNGVLSVTDTTAGLGPNSVTAWPTNPFTLPLAADALTLVVNSAVAARVALPLGPVPPTLNFTPLTSISFGCKFPYGLFCYASGVTGWFDVTAAAPQFNFNVPGLTVGSTTYGASSYAYNVNLDNMSSYMALIRAILSVVLWVGAVWFLASRLLGFGAGDPGEAVDEGLPV